ncbi:MAG TPA: hypothetical protein VMU93_14800 [Caulobacteraceae bacterium]|nr:hypothetical protein [Caulobacteraceae bacterium]
MAAGRRRGGGAIARLAEGAHRLDHWLKLRVGRPYTAILAFGLVVGVGASLRTLEQAVGSARSLAALGGVVVFQLALLVNQLAQLHEYREAARIRREERRRSRHEAPLAPGEPPRPAVGEERARGAQPQATFPSGSAQEAN